MRKLGTYAKAPMKQIFSCCGSCHPPRQCPAYGKKCAKCGKINHFREACGRVRSRIIHNLEQEPEQYQEKEDHIDTVKIHFINLSSKCSAIVTNLKPSSNQARVIEPH